MIVVDGVVRKEREGEGSAGSALPPAEPPRLLLVSASSSAACGLSHPSHPGATPHSRLAANADRRNGLGRLGTDVMDPPLSSRPPTDPGLDSCF